MVSVVFFSAPSIDGAYLSRSLEYQGYCSDDDPEDDFFKPGKAQMGNRVHEDYCNGDVLFQQYCSNGRNVKTRRAYICPNGCFEGACLK